MTYRTRSTRTLANAAIVEGVFSFMWFGWGQEGPPAWGVIVLGIGAGLSVLVAVTGIVCARRARDEPSPLVGSVTGRRFGIIVGTEFASSGVGAAILGITGHTAFISVWVCFVVGVHFVPLARVFPGIGMTGLAVAVVLVAVAALIVGVNTTILPSTPAGMGAGVCLLAHAGSLLRAAHQLRSSRTAGNA